MPGGDGTGPVGMGAMTGRGRGFCSGFQTPGFMSPMPGRAFGGGFGRGRRQRFFGYGATGQASPWPGQAFGRRRGWRADWADPPPPAAAPASDADEVQWLKNQAAYYEGALKDIVSRLEELESSPKTDQG